MMVTLLAERKLGPTQNSPTATTIAKVTAMLVTDPVSKSRNPRRSTPPVETALAVSALIA